MLTLSSHFDELLHRIQPKTERTDVAKALPAEIRDYLKECDTIQTVDPHSRLAGSYARDTAVGNIKDVDIILLVDPKYQEGDVETVLDDLHTALQGLPEFLGDTGIVEPLLRRQRRSIHVHFDNRDFDVDVVPAVAPDGLKHPLWVPDKDWSRWVETDPLGYAEHLSNLNAEHDQKVVPLIKLVKHWRDVQMIYRRPKSYWLECLVVRHIEKKWIMTDSKSYAELFAALLGSIQERFTSTLEEKDAIPQILDPMLGNNVAWNWKRAEFETFMRQVSESYRWATRALELDDDKQEEAIRLWQNIFNTDEQEYFPTSVDDRLREIADMATQGKGLYMTSAGKVLAKPSADVRAWPSPPHRFYGEE